MSHNQNGEGHASTETANAPAKSLTRSKRAPGAKSAYFMGAASGAALALFAPMLRPLAKSAVKGGILVGRQARKVGSNIKEEFEDIASEAQAELDRNPGRPGCAPTE